MLEIFNNLSILDQFLAVLIACVGAYAGLRFFSLAIFISWWEAKYKIEKKEKR